MWKLDFAVWVEAGELQYLATEFTEELEGHQNAVLAVHARAPIFHRDPEFEYVRSSHIFHIEFAKRWQ
jgi:hypothetical protein